LNIEISTAEKKPFILVNSERVDFKDGISSILEYKEWTRDDMAHYLKVSPRTVQGWVLGRKPSNSAIMALSFMLN